VRARFLRFTSELGLLYQEAATNGIEALESLVVAYEATGKPLPQPRTVYAA